MISQEGDYYICAGDQPQAPPSPKHNNQNDQIIEARGDIRERLSHIKQRIQLLKVVKSDTVNNQKRSAWLSLVDQPERTPQNFQLSMEIPQDILELDRRIQKLQQKILGYEIQRQKIEKKGTVVDRVKTLQKKLKQMLNAKSIEKQTNNIIQYSTNIDEKEEYMKQLFIYEVNTKTQGMNQELNIMQQYLENLSLVQKKIDTTLPINQLVKDHNLILKKSSAMRQRTQNLFKHMKEEYKKLLSKIQEIEV